MLPDSTLQRAECGLTKLFGEALGHPDDEATVRSGDRFFDQFRRTLELPGAFRYPFDSLNLITGLTAPDGMFRIFTWNLPLQDGSNRFYGLALLQEGSDNHFRVIPLLDQSFNTEEPEGAILSPESWFGAIYYQVIPRELPGGSRFYTLLGWHGDNRLQSSRLIEILTIDSNYSIRFGAPVFCDFSDQPVNRVLFRYSARAGMILRYEEQKIVVSKTWDARSGSFRIKSRKEFLIVCDHLVPSDPQLEGQYAYYLPAGDRIDGFIFRDACWHFIRNLDVRNPKSK